MGKVPAGLSEAMTQMKVQKQGHSYGGRGTTDQVEHLTKLVHILWKQVEKLESVVHVIPEGLQIKSGMSEVLILRNGGILIKGDRILIETPGRNEMFMPNK